MKIIKYKIMQEVNTGTEDTPDIQQHFYGVVLGPMPDSSFDANYAIALSEAYGEITVEEIEDEEPEPTEEEDTAAMLIDHEYRLTMLELFSDVAIE